MTEANNIDTDFDSKSILGATPLANNHQVEYQNASSATSQHFFTENNHLSVDSLPDQVATQPDNSENTEPKESLAQTMNWQKVAHKLREYNRKLLKKVFRLEQELAEINNKFNKHLEKSQSSDLLVANQAEEIKSYQEKIALLSHKLTSSQQQTSNQETIISNLSQQYDLSQKQSAQLERECTLLQEKYDQKTYELNTKEQETKELKTKLSQQQRCAIQYRSDLQRYLDKAESSSKTKAVNRQENLFNNRTIKPWSEKFVPPNPTKINKTTELPLTASTSNTLEPKISLPQTNPQPVPVKRMVAPKTETIKTAAKIATWSERQMTSSASTPIENQTAKKSSTSKKPQSLAAVDLPTFPRRS